MKETQDKIVTDKEENTKPEDERRSFLKKAAYAAPTLISLGTLMRTTDAKAAFGPPPSAPANW